MEIKKEKLIIGLALTGAGLLASEIINRKKLGVLTKRLNNTEEVPYIQELRICWHEYLWLHELSLQAPHIFQGISLRAIPEAQVQIIP